MWKGCVLILVLVVLAAAITPPAAAQDAAPALSLNFTVPQDFDPVTFFIRDLGSFTLTGGSADGFDLHGEVPGLPGLLKDVTQICVLFQWSGKVTCQSFANFGKVPWTVSCTGSPDPMAGPNWKVLFTAVLPADPFLPRSAPINDALILGNFNGIDWRSFANLNWHVDNPNMTPPDIMTQATLTSSSRKFDLTPPKVTASGPGSIPATGQITNVTITGKVTDMDTVSGDTFVPASGVNLTSGKFIASDPYGTWQPTGTFTIQANGCYSVSVPLQAVINGPPRTYLIKITARDNANNLGSATVPVTVGGFNSP